VERDRTAANIDPHITDLKALIIQLRHCIAHFDLTFISNSSAFKIDEIHFTNAQKKNLLVAKFIPEELRTFVEYYGKWIIAIIP
jgi:hypothetical protein